MKYIYKSTIYWILCTLIMLFAATWQRMSGPSYPKKGTIEIVDQTVSYKLIRSHESGEDAPIVLVNIDSELRGELHYKRLNVEEEWTIVPLQRHADTLSAFLPTQPLAGKLVYSVLLGKETLQPLCEPVVIRFKGAVPLGFLIPHIILMFLAMLFSLRTGLEAAVNEKNSYIYTWFTVLFLLLGGLIFGPIVQKYAFGSLWAGWPFGGDLTDNKTLFAFIFWIVALVMQYRKAKSGKMWVLIACTVLFLIYLIPHSMFGSELDYSSGEVISASK